MSGNLEQARRHLIALQRRNGGADGSWDPTSRWGSRGGRVYTTALATLTLEVYYRYLPIYGGRDAEYKPD